VKIERNLLSKVKRKNEKVLSKKAGLKGGKKTGKGQSKNMRTISSKFESG